MLLSELYAELSARTGLSKKDAEKSIKALQEIIVEEVTAGGSVSLNNFATFVSKEVPERVYQSPKTKEDIVKAAHKEMKVKVAKRLKDI